jgi:hypothetical protein
MYIIIVDNLSKFPVVKKIKSTGATEIIKCLKEVFGDFGIPNRVICDRGMNFTFREFKQFGLGWNFDIVYTSAEHHQSHGQTERFVQTVKQLLRKCAEAGDDPHLALLTLRCTPVSSTIEAPCVLLNKRVFKSSIVSLTSLQNCDGALDPVREKLSQEKARMQSQGPTRILKELCIGDKVTYYLPKSKQWIVGYITAKSGHDYELQNLSGRYVRRNRKMIKLCKIPDAEPDIYDKTVLPTPDTAQRASVDLPRNTATEQSTLATATRSVVTGKPVAARTPARTRQPVVTTPVTAAPPGRRSMRTRKMPSHLKDFVLK